MSIEYRFFCFVGMAVLAAACGTGAGDAEPGAESDAATATPFDESRFAVGNESALRPLVSPEAEVTKLAGDMMFVEGPVWRAEDGGHLIFSDIPANELKRWDRAGGVRTFRTESGPANGNTLDRQGRLVSAQHDGRVTRTEPDGSITTLVSAAEGRRLSSPNDVVVRSDGTVWFTDPTYGLAGRQQETPGNYVYRLEPESGRLTAVVTDTDQPNGLCFSPDESILYVADSAQGTRHIRRFRVGADGALTGGELFAAIDRGAPDGIRCDERGNVWSSAGDGVRIFSPAGEHVGTILVPEAPANLEFGGPDGRTLYITARTSLYSVPVLVGDGKRR